MKYLFKLSIYLLAANIVYSQQINLPLQKAKVVNSIINKLLSQESYDRCLVLVDLKEKPIRTSRGYAARIVVSDSLIDDHLALTYLHQMVSQEAGEKEKLMINTFEEAKFNNHFQIINSDLFTGAQDISGKKVNYLEIRQPVDGWEWMNVLVTDSMNYGAKFSQFQFRQINIPVYIYSSTSEKETSTLYLFRFQMSYKNESFDIDYIDKIVIGMN